MKKTLLLLVIILSFKCAAQEAFTVSDVVQVDGVTQKELYGRAKFWFADVYKSSKDVIQTADPEVGQILGKALFTFKPKQFIGSAAVQGDVSYTIKVFVKEGKYKCEVTDFYHPVMGNITNAEEGDFKIFGASKGQKNKYWKDVKEQCKEEGEKLTKSIALAMNKKASTDF